MYSIARRYVHGDNAPIDQGFINWIGLYEPQSATFDEIIISDYWGVVKCFGIVPITRNKAYWAGAIATSDTGPYRPEDYLSELNHHFAEWPQPVQELLTSTPAYLINKIYVHDHDPIDTWHRDNLIIIGDAAHAPLPTSGQGACQALEDAWHLANCLQDNQHDVRTAFSLFNSIRYEKTSNITHAARTFASSLFNRSEDFCRVRNEKSRSTNFAQLVTAMAQAWAQNLPLNRERIS